jgi:predicted DsbA family dithiol-disulfide isomerase
MQEATAQLDLSGLSVLARDVGLEPDLLIPCVESQRYRVTIEQQVLEANRNGVHSTPTFIIGRSTEAGVEGELVVGTLSYEAFAAKLNSLGTH